MHSYVYKIIGMGHTGAMQKKSKWSRSPGRARLPVHEVGTRSQCKQTPGEWARNSLEDQLPSHSKWCGHPKSHLDYCC